MPNYSYTCESCGTFTIRQRISEQHETALCPSFQHTARREFVAFQTYNMDPRVKRRIERGQQPRLVKRDALPVQQRQSQQMARPWMAGH